MVGSRLSWDEHTPAVRRMRRTIDVHRRTRTLPGSDRVVGSVERDFAGLVTARVQAGVLRYSDRQTLLSTAQRMGIGRFDANLLIAMAQHRCQRQVLPEPKRARRWPLVAVAAALQVAILSGFYWLTR